jgi:hypothetical protein
MQIQTHEICPVTVLAAYLAKFPGKATGKLFEGSSQYDHFRTLSQRVMIADEIMAMSVDPRNLGVHSIRKGDATFCCNGTTSGVSITAVYSGGHSEMVCSRNLAQYCESPVINTVVS